MKAEIEQNLERQEVVQGEAVHPSSDGEEAKKTSCKGDQVGRNDLCKCGSGKNIKTAVALGSNIGGSPGCFANFYIKNV